MAKPAISLILLCLMLIAMPVVHGLAQGLPAAEEWYQNLSLKKQKITKLRFYFHDAVSGKNPTSITVAKANTSATSPTFFGGINMVDNPITSGHRLSSRLLGHAQGMFGSASREELDLLMTMNFVFSYGKYNGSTLVLLGHNPAFNKYREMSIVGGSGMFRMARGIATAETYSLNLTTLNAIVKYHVIALHY